MIVRRLDANHDMTFGFGAGNYARDAEAVRQSVRTRLLTHLGEWFLDLDAGVPWLDRILTKPADLALAESLIKRCIAQTEGVASIDRFALTFDRSARAVSIAAAVTTIYGPIDLRLSA